MDNHQTLNNRLYSILLKNFTKRCLSKYSKQPRPARRGCLLFGFLMSTTAGGRTVINLRVFGAFGDQEACQSTL